MKNQIIKREARVDSIENQLDEIEVGQWYWVKLKDYGEKESTKKLCCVKEIGSNYVQVETYYTRWSEYNKKTEDGHSSWKISFEEFNEISQLELDWQGYFNNRAQNIQEQIKQKTELLISEGKKLCLIVPKKESDDSSTLLPSTVIVNPIKYKTDLVAFQENRMPEIQKEIQALSVDFAMTAKNMGLSAMNKLEFVKSKLNIVEDKIFTIELYAGIHENIKQIANGDPGSIDEKITIRQQMLFMDEETLIDFNRGGMDYQRLGDFDKWIVKPENLSRILPEQKGVVAFQVRRNRKERGPINSFWEVFERVYEEMKDMKTYLLIRNGEKVYRIATAIDFSPRLIPLENEIGDAQFRKSADRWFSYGDKNGDEIITPDDLNYDYHVGLLNDIIKKYNKIFIFIQGLLDRSEVFHPHLVIKLGQTESLMRWINIIRDEEKGLPNNTITYEGYRDQLNKSLCKGKFVYSIWFPEDYGRYRSFSDHQVYSYKESQVIHRPEICEVEWINKDKSSIQIKWEAETDWCYSNKRNIITRHLKIPTKEVFNVTDYSPGDFKMFLCDRSLKGQYLEWAPQLLSAEEYHKNKNRPKLRRRVKY